MNKIVFLLALLVYNINYSQDCPNRIGLLVINNTTLDDFNKVCTSCSLYGLSTIENYKEYSLYEVSQDHLDDEFSIESLVYEIKPDLTNIKTFYNTEIASVNDSTRVFFIPTYLTNGIYIKNLLLKFYNEKLYYISASLSKEYLDIILEKYKGKGHKSEEKITLSSCKNPKFKKYKNTYTQYFFSNEIDNVRALLTMDFKLNKYCEMITNDKIEIFDFNIYVRETDKIIPALNKLIEDQKLQNKLEKEERLKGF